LFQVVTPLEEIEWCYCIGICDIFPSYFLLKTYCTLLKNVIMFSVKNAYYIGIDVGGTKISGALITSQGKILTRTKLASPKNAHPSEIVRVIAGVVQEILSENIVARSAIKGLGVGIPGVVEATRKKIVTTPNIRLSGIALAHLLEKKFHIKTLLENDVNLGTLGEKHFGAAKKFHHVVGLFPGTGIGGGIIIHDRLMSGAHGAAGELGHMTMKLNGPLCGCGHHGCLEALASRWAIERDIHEAIRQGQKTILKKLVKNKFGTIKSGALKEALRYNDALTKKILTEKSRILGQACVSLRRIFDPEMIILGGGLMEACGGFMLPIIKKAVLSDRFFAKLKPCPVALSKLGDDAVLLGAAALFKLVDASS